MSLRNRVKQGLIAAAGSAAIFGLSILRIAAAREADSHVRNSSLATLAFSVLSGLVWSQMPNAKEDLEDVMDEVKEEMGPSVKQALNIVIADETGTTSTYTQSSYERGASKVRSIGDDPSWSRSSAPWDE